MPSDGKFFRERRVRTLLLCCLDQAMNAERLKPSRARRWPRLLAIAAFLWMGPLQADGLEGRFEVRSADLQLQDGVYHLNAHLDCR